MATNVYEKFDKALGNVHSAWVILNNGVKIGRVVVVGKTAYVHFMGKEMQFGVATGGGYDLTGAAISIAARKSEKIRVDNALNDDIWETFNRILINADNGSSWEYEFNKVGMEAISVF